MSRNPRGVGFFNSGNRGLAAYTAAHNKNKAGKQGFAMQFRRSDYDVTNTVQVSLVAAVRRAVVELFAQHWPKGNVEQLEVAFCDFERLFTGQYPGYLGCDTLYHDLQHSLDDTLAMARLLAGHDRSHAPAQQLGATRALVGLITALFHDAGYIRQSNESGPRNGAEFTRIHVSRGAEFLAAYLPQAGLAQWAPIATQVIHFTGYEVPFDQIRLDDPLDRRIGHLLGTGDLLAQMADRCYLEKCRDYLYPEFVLAGIAVSTSDSGRFNVQYGSGLDVLRQTPTFFAEIRRTRLDGEFGGAYRYVEALFDGRNPYMEAIESHLKYLREIMRTQRWSLLRRTPTTVTWERNSVQNARMLARDRLRQAMSAARA